MQNLQEPYPLGHYGKSLIWRVGTQFRWLESHTVTTNYLPPLQKIRRKRIYTYIKDAFPFSLTPKGLKCGHFNENQMGNVRIPMPPS
jgi:hypothetical protein